MNHYAAGARLERLARQNLESDGYSVMRSAGSKGAWDLIAWGGNSCEPYVMVRFIQVKKAGQVTAEARRKFESASLKLPLFGRAEIWERDPSQPSGWNVILGSRRNFSLSVCENKDGYQAGPGRTQRNSLRRRRDAAGLRSQTHRDPTARRG